MNHLYKDRIVRHMMLGLTVFCILLLLSVGVGLCIKAFPVMKEKGLMHLLTTTSWKPFQGDFGFLSYIWSTLYVTAIAIALALPPALLSGIYLCEYAGSRIRNFFNPVIDLLAGIPPVIYGVWGTLAIVPLIADKIAPRYVDYSSGYSVLAGGVVLAIMIIPLLIGIFLEIFNAIPAEMREASLSLGATKWQTVKKIVLRKSAPGIFAAVVLAISRAFGETIAVLMVCGNFAGIPSSIFASCYPLPALIANNYGEMMSLPAYESALMFAAFILFIIILLFNAVSRVVLQRIERRYA